MIGILIVNGKGRPRSLPGLPFREEAQNPHGLLIEQRVAGHADADISQVTILFDRQLKYDRPRDTLAACIRGIFDIPAEKIAEL